MAAAATAAAVILSAHLDDAAAAGSVKDGYMVDTVKVWADLIKSYKLWTHRRPIKALKLGRPAAPETLPCPYVSVSHDYSYTAVRPSNELLVTWCCL